MNPLKVALLSYQPEQDAVPRMVAKGQGELAERILSIAREHNIPIQEQPDLLQHLYRLDVNSQIPPQLYASVAMLLALVLLLDKTHTPLSS